MDFPIQNLAVIGAGAMGSGIAALFASQGLPVVLIDPVEGALARAAQVIERQLGVYAPHDVPACLARIRMSPELQAAADCDLVIEAVPEKLDLKRHLFAQLDQLCKPATIFATNTSGLSINAIAQAVTRRDRFVGTHFFTPADVIPLVEVVRGDQSSEATVDLVMATLKAAGKRPVRVNRDIPASSPTASSTPWPARPFRCWKKASPAPRISTKSSNGAWASVWRCPARWSSAT